MIFFFQIILRFLLGCQLADGGFQNELVDSVKTYYFKQSDFISTVYGLVILRKLGLYSGKYKDVYQNANTFLRYQLENKKLELSEIFYFINLISTYPDLEFGIRNDIQNIFISIGILLILISFGVFYSDQVNKIFSLLSNLLCLKKKIPDEAFVELIKPLQIITLLIALAGISLHFFPSIAFILYFLLVFYLLMQYYEIQAKDNSLREMLLISNLNSLVFMVTSF